MKEFSKDLRIHLIRFSKNFPLKKYFEIKIENQEKYPQRKKNVKKKEEEKQLK